SRAALDHVLPDVGALARHEALLRAVRRNARPPDLRVRRREKRVGLAEQCDTLGDRDAERIAPDRRPVLTALRGLRYLGDRCLMDGGRRLRAMDRLTEERRQLLARRRAVRRGEAPRAVDDDADPDA